MTGRVQVVEAEVVVILELRDDDVVRLRPGVGVAERRHFRYQGHPGGIDRAPEELRGIGDRGVEIPGGGIRAGQQVELMMVVQRRLAGGAGIEAVLVRRRADEVHLGLAALGVVGPVGDRAIFTAFL